MLNVLDVIVFDVSHRPHRTQITQTVPVKNDTAQARADIFVSKKLRNEKRKFIRFYSFIKINFNNFTSNIYNKL